MDWAWFSDLAAERYQPQQPIASLSVAVFSRSTAAGVKQPSLAKRVILFGDIAATTDADLTLGLVSRLNAQDK